MLFFLKNYGCYEANFGIKMTARQFSTIHLSMKQFIERNFTFLPHFIKEGCCSGSICVGISGVCGPNVALGYKLPMKKESRDGYKSWHLFTKKGKMFFLVSEQRRRSWNWIMFFDNVFIGPESDHWQCLSLTHWLTHSLTPWRLVNLIDATLACEDAYSKLVEIVTVAYVSDEDGVGNSLLQILKLRFGHIA